MPVTQQDIAKKLGVSQRLISYALNGQSGVSDEMRRKIREEAESLGYRPHRAAQALVTGRTYQIALCFPWFLGSSFYNAIIREFEILARETPYDLLMVTVDPQGEKGSNLQFTSDGTIFIGPAANLPRNVVQPAVAIQNQVRIAPTEVAKQFDHVQLNIERASIAAVHHLVEAGLRRIAYVAPDNMIGDFEWRCYAYNTVVQKAGLIPEIIALPIANEELIRQQSHHMLKEYFGKNGFPDAVFCCNDDIGMGAYRALSELKRSVPSQTVVVGFDDLDYVNYLSPPMTSVHMPISEACCKAWTMLMQRLENPSLPPQFEMVEAHLVVRESSLRKSNRSQR
jgi:LacI family transcriptional regulator